ncbi:MAG: hypothetical protein DRJ42_01070 [Deltaproteobacteria bacterium]|nr:MAG: hypothetical protein DRJ42_01070 [Deltaproteobacteria bacterium]
MITQRHIFRAYRVCAPVEEGRRVACDCGTIVYAYADAGVDDAIDERMAEALRQLAPFEPFERRNSPPKGPAR